MERIELTNMIAGEQYYIEERPWGDEVKPYRKKIGTLHFVHRDYGVFDNVSYIDDGSEWTGGELFSISGYIFYKKI